MMKFIRNSISELLDVTCHVIAQCYLPADTSEHIPPYPQSEAGTRFTYPGGMEG